ncbi:hypothetical protein PUN28_015498 [Cardiocondyla obscurior]|uniref:Uncharacterized protein n=1 Tax=Cardiocondyla obscurior TaxID=286306 RepID=A0AAW2EXP3_9HYME
MFIDNCGEHLGVFSRAVRRERGRSIAQLERPGVSRETLPPRCEFRAKAFAGPPTVCRYTPTRINNGARNVVPPRFRGEALSSPRIPSMATLLLIYSGNVAASCRSCLIALQFNVNRKQPVASCDC